MTTFTTKEIRLKQGSKQIINRALTLLAFGAVTALLIATLSVNAAKPPKPDASAGTSEATCGH